MGIAAVPPFRFASLDSLVDATVGWLRFKLTEKKPALLPTLDALVGRYRSGSLDEEARQLARRRLDLADARLIVEDYAARAALGNPTHVAGFLRDAALLTRDAGFSGLCVFADEMQIFVQSGEPRERIEEIKQLVLALRTVEAPLAFVVALYENILQRMSEQAGDAVSRLAGDGIEVRLDALMDSRFPATVLEHLCRRAGVSMDSVAAPDALTALGQIGARRDLANGPRTVIAALIAITRHHAATGRSYEATELARDFERGAILFEGMDKQISGVVSRLLAEDVVREKPQYTEAVRFLCAFPEGATHQTLDRAGHLNAVEDMGMTRGLLGSVLYAPRTGVWALRALETSAATSEKIPQVIQSFRDLWWANAGKAERRDAAREAFATLVLPLIFPRRGSGEDRRAKFGDHLPLRLRDPRPDPVRVRLEGSFEGTRNQFPRRRVDVIVATDAKAAARASAKPGFAGDADDAHLIFAFTLTRSGDAPHRIETTNGERRVDFVLNLEASIGAEFPPNSNCSPTA